MPLLKCSSQNGVFLWFVWVFTLRQHSQIYYKLHSVPDHTERHEPSSSNPQLHVPAMGPCHCPSPPWCHVLPKSTSKEMGGFLFAGNRKYGKFPHWSCQWQTSCLNSVAECTCVGMTCLVSQPDQKWTSVPSQRSSEAASSWQQILIIRGSTTVLFFLRNPYCLLLLSLKKKNFPSPRSWHIRVKNPIKEQ